MILKVSQNHQLQQQQRRRRRRRLESMNNMIYFIGSTMALLLLSSSLSIPGAFAEDTNDVCAEYVSNGDKAAGLTAFADSSCKSGGLGCHPGHLGTYCRFCAMFPTSSSLQFPACRTPTPTNSPTTDNNNNNNNVVYPAPTPNPPPTPNNNNNGNNNSGGNNGNQYGNSHISNDVSCPRKLCRDNTSGQCLNDRTFLCVESTKDGRCPYGSTHCSDVLFADDFQGKFNLKTWKHEITMAGGGNWEFQLYRNNRTNSYVKDGILNIKPTLTEEWFPSLGKLEMFGLTEASDCTSNAFYGCSRNDASPISSARISTVNSFTFTSGRVEVRARLPRGDWIWPAIWLLPKYENYGMWPVSGEIDIMETTGNEAGYAHTMGVDSVASTLHWGMNYEQNEFSKTHASYTKTNGKTFADDYHIFGLVRHNTGLYTYIDTDDNSILEVDWSKESFYKRGNWDSNVWDNPWENGDEDYPNGTPFVNEEFFLIFNVAVGGNYFPDDVDAENKPWSKTSTRAQWDFYERKDEWYPSWEQNDPRLQIDWVKVTKE